MTHHDHAFLEDELNMVVSTIYKCSKNELFPKEVLLLAFVTILEFYRGRPTHENQNFSAMEMMCLYPISMAKKDWWKREDNGQVGDQCVYVQLIRLIKIRSCQGIVINSTKWQNQIKDR